MQSPLPPRGADCLTECARWAYCFIFNRNELFLIEMSGFFLNEMNFFLIEMNGSL